jgi:hypothetical protein
MYTSGLIGRTLIISTSIWKSQGAYCTQYVVVCTLKHILHCRSLIAGYTKQMRTAWQIKKAALLFFVSVLSNIMSIHVPPLENSKNIFCMATLIELVRFFA